MPPTQTTNALPHPAPETPAEKRRVVRLFVVGAAEPTVRRATDVLLIVPALLVLAVLIVVQPASGIEAAIEDLIASLPGWLDGLWGLTYDLLVLTAIGLLVAAFVTHRTRVALQALLAVVLAVVIALVASRIGLGRWPDIPEYVTGDPDAPRFPGGARRLGLGRRRDHAARPGASDAARGPLDPADSARSAPCCCRCRRRAVSSPAC